MQTLIIYGPPGTGKTHTLQEVVKDYGKPTLCVSFTKAAAQELGAREIGSRASTLHSLAYRALDLGSYQVVDREKLTGLSREIGISFRGGQYDEFLTEGDEYLALLGYARNTFKSIEEVSEKVFLGTAGGFTWFSKVYKEWKRQHDLVDFDDMLHLTAFGDVDLKGEWSGFVIDEAQDLTPVQWVLIKQIIKQNNFERVWVAGDDDQAIFTWAGASPLGMEEFRQWSDGEDVVLKKSYRIPKKVHQVAEAVIAKISNRKDKEYTPRDFPGEIHQVFCLHNVDKFDVILYRNHSIGKEIALELRNLGIPYTGRNVLSPYNSRYARMIMAYNLVIRGNKIPGRMIKTIEQVTKKEMSALFKQRQHWSKVFHLPPSVHTDLSVMETRFGPIHKLKPVILSTIHQYKGKEEDAVLLIDSMNERTKEGYALNPDSEIRVFYVGVTRAKKALGIYEHNNPIGLRSLIRV